MNTDSASANRATADDAVALKVDLMTRLCASNACPTVYRTNRGTLVVQGYRVSAEDAGIDLPQSELLVEIPPELLAAAARAME